MEKHILDEGKIDILTNLYPAQIISKEVLDQLFEADPSEEKDYSDWMIKQNIRTSQHPHNINNHIISTVKDFHFLHPKLQIPDLNYYEDLEYLQELLSGIKNRLTKKERKQYGIDEGEIIYEDTVFIISNPQSQFQLCNSAHDTNWCSSKFDFNLDDFVCYVVTHKKLEYPDIMKFEDHDKFNSLHQNYQRYRKILVLMDKSFHGSAMQADLNDYLIYDALGDDFRGSIYEVTNHTVEDEIFQHFAHKADRSVKKVKDILNIDVHTIREWSEKHHQSAELLIGRLNNLKELHLNEVYHNPEIKEGDRIELIYMDDPYARKKLPHGLQGTITSIETVDGTQQYGVKWDNGSTLALIPKLDLFKKI